MMVHDPMIWGTVPLRLYLVIVLMWVSLWVILEWLLLLLSMMEAGAVVRLRGWGEWLLPIRKGLEGRISAFCLVWVMLNSVGFLLPRSCKRCRLVGRIRVLLKIVLRLLTTARFALILLELTLIASLEHRSGWFSRLLVLLIISLLKAKLSERLLEVIQVRLGRVLSVLSCLLRLLLSTLTKHFLTHRPKFHLRLILELDLSEDRILLALS